MNIFVTGAAGFAGTHLVRYFLSAGHGVTAHSRRIPQPLVNDAEGRLSRVQGDLAQLKELPEEIDAVIHAAATLPTPTKRIADFIRDNVVATENLVQMSSQCGVRKFVFFSSLSIYGEISGSLVDEQTPIVNPDVYGASKLFGELCLREQKNDIASLALRLPAILGHGAARHWLASTLENVRAGQPIRIFNPSAPFNNAVYIQDLCVFLDKWLSDDRKGCDAVTLAANGQMSIQDIVAHLIAVSRSSSRIVVDPVPRRSFLVSSERAKRNYGYTPRNFNAMLDSYVSEEVSSHVG
jgi:UDP-glucose 4-epimerase